MEKNNISYEDIEDVELVESQFESDEGSLIEKFDALIDKIEDEYIKRSRKTRIEELNKSKEGYEKDISRLQESLEKAKSENKSIIEIENQINSIQDSVNAILDDIVDDLKDEELLRKAVDKKIKDHKKFLDSEILDIKQKKEAQINKIQSKNKFNELDKNYQSTYSKIQSDYDKAVSEIMKKHNNPAAKIADIQEQISKIKTEMESLKVTVNSKYKTLYDQKSAEERKKDEEQKTTTFTDKRIKLPDNVENKEKLIKQIIENVTKSLNEDGTINLKDLAQMKETTTREAELEKRFTQLAQQEFSDFCKPLDKTLINFENQMFVANKNLRQAIKEERKIKRKFSKDLSKESKGLKKEFKLIDNLSEAKHYEFKGIEYTQDLKKKKKENSKKQKAEVDSFEKFDSLEVKSSNKKKKVEKKPKSNSKFSSFLNKINPVSIIAKKSKERKYKKIQTRTDTILNSSFVSDKQKLMEGLTKQVEKEVSNNRDYKAYSGSVQVVDKSI